MPMTRRGTVYSARRPDAARPRSSHPPPTADRPISLPKVHRRGADHGLTFEAAAASGGASARLGGRTNRITTIPTSAAADIVSSTPV
jgi:hypothetical protein